MSLVEISFDSEQTARIKCSVVEPDRPQYKSFAPMQGLVSNRVDVEAVDLAGVMVVVN